MGMRLRLRLRPVPIQMEYISVVRRTLSVDLI